MSDQPPPKPAISTSRFSQVASALSLVTPILVAGFGFVLNNGIEDSKNRIEQNKIAIASAKERIEENSARLIDLKTAAETADIVHRERMDKVKIINDFLLELLSPDRRRRSLAIEAVLIALPDEASRILAVLQREENATDIDKNALLAAFAATRERLVAEMFSDSKSTRIAALEALERGWIHDAQLINQLIAKAQQVTAQRSDNQWNKIATDDPLYWQVAGLYNTIHFFAALHMLPEGANDKELASLLKEVDANSTDTKRLAGRVRAQLHLQ